MQNKTAEGPRASTNAAAHVCVRCGNAADNQCSGCGVAYYCSSACQRLHWTVHKPVCVHKKTPSNRIAMFDASRTYALPHDNGGRLLGIHEECMAMLAQMPQLPLDEQDERVDTVVVMLKEARNGWLKRGDYLGAARTSHSIMNAYCGNNMYVKAHKIVKKTESYMTRYYASWKTGTNKVSTFPPTSAYTVEMKEGLDLMHARVRAGYLTVLNTAEFTAVKLLDAGPQRAARYAALIESFKAQYSRHAEVTLNYQTQSDNGRLRVGLHLSQQQSLSGCVTTSSCICAIVYAMVTAGEHVMLSNFDPLSVYSVYHQHAHRLTHTHGLSTCPHILRTLDMWRAALESRTFRA